MAIQNCLIHVLRKLRNANSPIVSYMTAVSHRPVTYQVKELPVNIPEFYKNKCILITGATGFVGQALVEKILRSCSGVQRIYVIVRRKKTETPACRIKQFLKLEIFDKIRRETPDVLDKIVPINGDLERQNMGLSSHDYKHLSETVSVVIHSAALIKLNPPLRDAIAGNIMPMDNVRQFVEVCKGLDVSIPKVFLHVSTYFCNLGIEKIDEIIYPTSHTAKQLLDLNRSLENVELERMRSDILGTSPLTYLYTKKVAETMTRDIASKVPVVIMRPSLVTSALLEPYPGWKYGISGYIGVMEMISKGYIPSFYGNPDCAVEVIPVDLVVNTILASSWYVGTKQHTTHAAGEPFVVNCISSTVNKLALKEFVYYINEFFKNMGDSSKCMKISRNRFEWIIRSLVVGLRKDIQALTRGEKTSHTKTHVFALRVMTLLEAGMTEFEEEKIFNNAELIRNKLRQEDKRTFIMDPREIDWETYIGICSTLVANENEDRIKKH